jgi:exosortase
VTLALAASYAPCLRELVLQWWHEPNYTHGFLVAPIAFWILWRRRDRLDPAKLRPSWLGWLALLAVLGLRAYLFERNEQWLEAATIPVAAACLTWAFGGLRLLLWAAPGLLFLFFLLPLPPSVNLILAEPLQRLATTCSTALLQVMGLPVLAEGNVIIVGSDRLEVARACNGLSMLLSFATLIAATVLLVDDRPVWERVVLLLSVVPIALIANVLRIAATAWCYHLFGASFGDKVAHDTAGWAMMPVALALVWLELRALSWLVVEDEAEAGPRVVLR